MALYVVILLGAIFIHTSSASCCLRTDPPESITDGLKIKKDLIDNKKEVT